MCGFFGPPCSACRQTEKKQRNATQRPSLVLHLARNEIHTFFTFAERFYQLRLKRNLVSTCRHPKLNPNFDPLIPGSRTCRGQSLLTLKSIVQSRFPFIQHGQSDTHTDTQHHTCNWTSYSRRRGYDNDRHLGFVIHVTGPPTTHIWWSLPLREIWLELGIIQ